MRMLVSLANISVAAVEFGAINAEAAEVDALFHEGDQSRARGAACGVRGMRGGVGDGDDCGDGSATADEGERVAGFDLGDEFGGGFFGFFFGDAAHELDLCSDSNWRMRLR